MNRIPIYSKMDYCLMLDRPRQRKLLEMVENDISKTSKSITTFQAFVDNCPEKSAFGERFHQMNIDDLEHYKKTLSLLLAQKANIDNGYIAINHYKNMTDLDFWFWVGTTDSLFEYGYRLWGYDFSSVYFLSSWLNMDIVMHIGTIIEFGEEINSIASGEVSISSHKYPRMKLKNWAKDHDSMEMFFKRISRFMLWVYRSNNIQSVPKLKRLNQWANEDG